LKENFNIYPNMLKKILFTLFIASMLAIFPSCLSSDCYSDPLSAQELVKCSDDLMRGDTSRGTYKMTVLTPQWERTLELKAYSIGRDKTFIRIISPPKEAGITTLRIDNNMWNYLPKVERTIKVPPSMMLQPWMGSDFTNDDLVKESSIVYDYTHRIVAEEDIDGMPAYKIELTPKPEAAVTWGKLILWVRREDCVPLREEFYTEHGKLVKVLQYSKIKQMSDRVIPTIWKMTSVTREGHYTIIEILDVVYNKPIDENIFTMANLKSPR